MEMEGEKEMSCGQYPLAELTAKELQKLKEAEKSLNNLAGSGISSKQADEQEIVLVAYRHAHQESSL